MKKGWEYKKLGEVANVNHGKNQKAVEDVHGKYPIYGSGGNIMGFANNYLCDAGTTILGRKGTINNPIFIETKFWNVDTAFGISAKEGTDKKYIYYFVKSQDWSKKDTGTTLPSLTQKVVKDTTVPVPPLSEQQRIVSYLDSAFAKIDAVAKNAEDSLNEAKALFLSALAKMMEPKEGWEEVSMDELCSIESALVNPTKADYINMLHVGGANIESYSGKLVNLKTAKEEKLSSGKFFFDNKAVLYNKIRPYLVKVAKPDFCGLCSADMYPLSPKNKVTREFLYYILISKDFTDYAIKSSARAGMPKINRNSLFAYKTSIPKDYKEQICITSKLDSIRRGLITLESNLTLTLSECAALKQSILRQTFE